MATPPPTPTPTHEDLQTTLQQLLQIQQTFQQNLTTLTTEVAQLRHRVGPPGFTQGPEHLHHKPFTTSSIKLEIPGFDGSDPLPWIFKINQFFEFHNTPEEQRLRLASFYMQGEALTWYQWLHSNGQLLSWQQFLHALELRFAPSHYDDPKGALFKLCQTSSVKDYQTTFESLANRINGLPSQFFLSCFISGLKPDIRREVQAFQPISLSHAISLAKLQEDKLADRGYNNSNTATSSKQPFRPPITTASTLKPQNAPKTPPPIKRLSPAELQARREQGLCYNCDEPNYFLLLTPPKTLHPHNNPPQTRPKLAFMPLWATLSPKPFKANTTLSQLLLTLDTTQNSAPPQQPISNQAQISLHALMGHPIPQTLRVVGHVAKSPITVLIDSGSTHNFIQDRIAKQLGLKLEPAQEFQVLVGNGEELQCSYFCPNLAITLGSNKFLVDVFVLPLSGAELVLGVQWLQTLGPILTDFEKLTMKFFYNGEVVQIAGTPKPSPEEASLHQLKRLVSTNALDTFFHIQASPSSPDNSPPPDDPEIQLLLQRFSKLFETPTSLPPPRLTDHRIPLLEGSNPVNVRPYRYPHFQKREIETQIAEMLQQGLIQPSSSAFSSPVLLVRKKDGAWRFCVDYRALNTITVKDRFPIPAIDELLDELYGTNYFSKLDLRAGYHQIRMEPHDIHKTAFRTHLGHYEFLVMPFGLCNAPSTFQSTMNVIFQPYLRHFVIVFFDDILVYSRTKAEHLKHLETVFQCLLENCFILKLSKCSFAQNSISYLGHIVSAEGVGPDPEKIEAMVNWPPPTTLKQLRGFLGLTGFYRKFVKDYAIIAQPLTELLKKDAFQWSEQAQVAFDHLKAAMTKAPVLALPNFEEDFMIETDASGIGMGAVLIQNNHPICYFSQKFCPKLMNASAYVRELCAITSAVKKWRTYLLGRKFVVHTDQRSLRELMTQVIQTPEQQFYLAKLLGYSYEIKYKPGTQNRVADALSRVHENFPSVMAITIPHWKFLEKLQAEINQDSEVKDLMSKVANDPNSYPNFKIIKGLLYFKGRLYIPASSSFKNILLEEIHATPVGGHSGIQRTYGRMKENFYWVGLKQDVVNYVNSCHTCQQTKDPTHAPYGLLQPLPIPKHIWEDISMDFIVGLPSFQHYTVIFVVVDRFSKAAHFGMLPTGFTAVKVAELFTTMVCKLHGMPHSIVSDRDPIFLSKFWQELFHLSGTKLRMSTAYHPQSDGQTEVVNKTLQQYLRCFVHDQPKRWGKYIHWAEWHYNTAIHTSTGYSPFQVVYGKPPPSLPQYLAGTSQLEALDSELSNREIILQNLKKKLLKAQQNMKIYADQHRSPHTFKTGDLVYVKLRPYRQTSLPAQRTHKLSKRFYGPFKLLRQIGDVAFELELPPESKIHPVFHVSKLKPCHDPASKPLVLPPDAVDNSPMVQPLAVLDWKEEPGQTSPQVLIQWAGLYPEDATWESFEEIKKAYPHLHLEDKSDREEIIKLLMQPHPQGDSDADKSMCVIPIVGIGGLGKTTLAKLVFDDRRMDQVFQLKMWVCVSNDFDIRQIIIKIINLTSSTLASVPTVIFSHQDNINNFDIGQLVRRSQIIMTTRSNSIASMMGDVPSYVLKGLSPEDCLSLFRKWAFKEGEETKYPNLLEIGKEIVKKCQGVPLAVRTLGSSLFSNLDIRENVVVVDSHTRNIPQQARHLSVVENDSLDPYLFPKSRKTLYIDNCDKLDLLLNNESPIQTLRLKHLYLRGFSTLVTLPGWIVCAMDTLETLDISNFPNLKMFPVFLTSMTCLKRLYIINCPQLLNLTSDMHRLTALENLCIDGCPELCRKYQPQSGEYWPMIAHIKTIFIGELTEQEVETGMKSSTLKG
ncbi:hypothetical protein TSUD_392450 [Trifolium subterraneum]|uniref:Reverse transcriptase n=1 Tax=Trifolium subterraneum TaxID=3900 RepID=A0A2Z6NEC3_TRISU|nr:hypothetical protein TSUD_392450 [Trifolium subterraneum]